MDFDKLKTNIQQVVEILEIVPEQFKERAFDALLPAALSDAQGKASGRTFNNDAEEETEGVGDVQYPEGFPEIKPKFARFLQDNQIAPADLERLLEFERDTVHFLRQPREDEKAAAQMNWALLLALAEGIKTGILTASYEATRAKCTEEQILDSGNFAGNFKKPKNKKLFLGALEAKNPTRRLSPDGEAELAKLIKGLAS